MNNLTPSPFYFLCSVFSLLLATSAIAEEIEFKLAPWEKPEKLAASSSPLKMLKVSLIVSSDQILTTGGLTLDLKILNTSPQKASFKDPVRLLPQVLIAMMSVDRKVEGILDGQLGPDPRIFKENSDKYPPGWYPPGSQPGLVLVSQNPEPTFENLRSISRTLDPGRALQIRLGMPYVRTVKERSVVPIPPGEYCILGIGLNLSLPPFVTSTDPLHAISYEITQEIHVRLHE